MESTVHHAGENGVRCGERRSGDPPKGVYCPVCLQRVPPQGVERRPHREHCASGPLDLWLYVCAKCGLPVAAEVLLTEEA